MTAPKRLSCIIDIREKTETDRNRDMGEFRVNIPKPDEPGPVRIGKGGGRQSGMAAKRPKGPHNQND